MPSDDVTRSISYSADMNNLLAAMNNQAANGSVAKTPPKTSRGADSGFVIQPIDTFSGRYNIANQTYYSYFDEALLNSYANSLAMRRDAFIYELLRHRQYPIISLPYHIEVDDPNDEDQKKVAEILSKIISAIPRYKTMLLTLLEAIFYGQSAVQVRYGKKMISGKEYTTIVEFVPINGDKIRWKWDGTPGISIRTGSQDDPSPANKELNYYREYISTTTLGQALFLKDQYIRDRFVIHRFEPSDTDYLYEINQAQSQIGGVGLRSRFYWAWNIRTEILSWVVDALQRVGVNGMIYGFYPEGDSASQLATLQALQMLVKDNISVFPVRSGESAKPFERIEPTSIGYEMMFHIIDHLEGIMRRGALGQELSSKAMPMDLGGGKQSDLQSSVRGDIIAYDATCLGETETEQIIGPILRYNYFDYKGQSIRGDQLPFACKLVIQIDDDKVQEKIAAAAQLFDMGIALDGDDLRDMAGLSPPKKEASKISSDMMAAKENFTKSIKGIDKADKEMKRFIDYVVDRSFKSGVLDVSRYSDCGHDGQGDFSHGNTCGSLRGSGKLKEHVHKKQSELRSDYKKSFAEMVEDQRNEYKDLRKEQKSERKFLPLEHAKELRDLDREHARNHRDKIRDHAREKDKMTRDHARERSRLEKSHIRNNTPLNERLAEMVELESDHSRYVQELADEHKDDLESMIQSNMEERKYYESTHADAIKEQGETHRSDRRNQREEFLESRREIRQEYLESKSELINNLKSKVKRISKKVKSKNINT